MLKGRRLTCWEEGDSPSRQKPSRNSCCKEEVFHGEKRNAKESMITNGEREVVLQKLEDKYMIFISQNLKWGEDYEAICIYYSHRN